MSTHLLNRSSYTLLNGAMNVTDLVKKAKKEGYTSIALTDQNVMYGAPSFQNACNALGMHAIHGMEVIVNYHDTKVPFLLLAKDNAGIKNLYRLSSLINDGRDYCEVDELIQYASHCFLIVYGEGGYLDSYIIHEDMEKIVDGLECMQKELPLFDVAISYNDSSLWVLKNKLLKQACRSLHISTVALNKNYYLNKEDDYILRFLNGVRDNRNIYDKGTHLLTGRYVLEQAVFEKLYDAEDLRRSDEIAKECTANLELPKTQLPKFFVPNGVTSGQYMTQLCLAGLKKRFDGGKVPQEYLKRLQYELSVILKMHFEDYFLIVYDFIRFARKNGIYVGPGRGSAAGSLVSYCLGITMIDPMQYNLLFERFLNPHRISMPDIDTDIPDIHRQDVIDYVYQTYGEDHVCNIVTFGTFGARQSLRDAGKFLAMSNYDINMVANMVPRTAKISLNDALNQNRRLKSIVNAEEKYQKLFRLAMAIEGMPRHTSLHAAGIIMSSLPLEDVIPTMHSDDGMKTSQFTMEHLEERGLIKMDFLGLRNLTIIDDIVKLVQKEDPSFKIMEIPLNDEATFEVFKHADTVGVFQFESSGMKNLLQKMKPCKFEDIVACLALYRPGPMENIPLYLSNRANPASIQYPHKDLIPILKETYGILIYQEQIMQTAKIAAGFSLAKADILRKAMSKKKVKELNMLKEDFIQGCLMNGYPKDVAMMLFAWIEKFAGYGFNKSHAVAYGMLAYQLAYLKAHAPYYFYKALLDSVVGNDEKTSEYISECRRRHVKVLYPDVNASYNTYTIQNGCIRLPFTQIKGLGYRIGDMIMEERKQGEFLDYYDFVARMMLHKVNRSQFESLIDAGACDCFKANRTTLRYGLDEAMQYGSLVQVMNGPQISLNFSIVTKPLISMRADNKEDILEREKDVLGMYLGPHPILEKRMQYKIQYPSLISISTRIGFVDGFALVKNVRQHRTKKGKMMAFVVMEDETTTMDLVVMPWVYETVAKDLKKGIYIVFRSKMEADGSCLANRITILK